MTITRDIEAKHYVATEHDVELLATEHLTSNQATQRSDGAYLRILVAILKGQFGNSNKRRKHTPADASQHRAFLTETHTRLYAHVLVGITTPDVMDDETLDIEIRRARATERNNRAGFARSSASTLGAFIKAGGDVRTLRVEDVTKTWLRAWVLEATQPGTSDRQRAVVATARRFVTELTKLCTENPEAGRVETMRAMEELQRVLDELDGPPDVPEGTQTQTRAGVESQVFQPQRGARFKPTPRPKVT